MSEGDENISMREINDDAPTPEDPPADEEEAELDNEGAGSGGEEDAPNARQSPTLQPEDGNEEEAAADEQAVPDPEEGRTTPAQPRLIAVTPSPGDASPEINGDYDSGVKIDNEEDDEEDELPRKPDKTPSLASSEASLRSMSPELQAPRKGGSSQPPRFSNEVQPEGYRRAPAPGFNRAMGTLQCKAMVVIMGASLIAMIFIVGYIILQSDEEIATKMVSLDGNFTIGNRPYFNTYEDPNSTQYQDLGQEFIDTMNSTFHKSATYGDIYSNSTVEWIRKYVVDTGLVTIDLPQVVFTVNLEIPAEDWSRGGNSTTDEAVTVPTGVEPPILTEIVAYLVNVTENNGFGTMTGHMSLDSGF